MPVPYEGVNIYDERCRTQIAAQVRLEANTSRGVRTLGNLRLAGYLTLNLLAVCAVRAARVAWPPSPLPALSVLCSAAHGFNTQDNKRSGSSGTLFRYFRND